MIKADEAQRETRLVLEQLRKKRETINADYEAYMLKGANNFLAPKLSGLEVTIKEQVALGEWKVSYLSRGGSEVKWDEKAAVLYFEPLGYEITVERLHQDMPLYIVISWEKRS